MTQFAGFLAFAQTNLTMEDPRSLDLEQRIQKSMLRASKLTVHTARYGAFFVAMQPLGLQGKHSLRKDEDVGVVAIAGDPIACAGALSLPDPKSRSDFEAALTDGTAEHLALARGTFAAVGYSARTGRVVLAVDSVGSRCLYYRLESDRLLFATRLSTLRLISSEHEALDEQGVSEWIFFGHCLGSRTVFSGTRLVQPDAAISVGPRRTLDTLRINRRSPESLEDLDLEGATRRIHTAFSIAVERRISGESQDAFLSGGMDSRAVVASLVDQGRKVRTFCTSFSGSLDDVVGNAIANHLGTEHFTWNRSPADRIRTSMDPFAAYARDHFPPEAQTNPLARQIWSGDGGSVTMGHVYLREKDVVRLATSGHPDEDDVRSVFPTLSRRPTRQISPGRMRHFTEAAIQGALDELRACWSERPDRRLFRFYMRNDQARHLHHHFEDIDLTRVELLTPFFDADLQSLVGALPTSLFLRHRLYNEWIKCFDCRPHLVYWQPYPDHLPGPHPKPPVKADQWSKAWFQGPAVRRAYRSLGHEVIAHLPDLARPLVSSGVIRLATLANLLGIGRIDYEIAHGWRVLSLLRRPS